MKQPLIGRFNPNCECTLVLHALENFGRDLFSSFFYSVFKGRINFHCKWLLHLKAGNGEHKITNICRHWWQKRSFFFFFQRELRAQIDGWKKQKKPETPPPLSTHAQHTHLSPFSRTCNSNSFYFYSLCILNRGKLFLLGYSTLLRVRHVKQRNGRRVCVGRRGATHMANTKKKKNCGG